jgi:hypothetical protein
MLKALRKKINSDIAGITACGCCSIGAVIIASVFLVFVVPEYQMINSFQQDSCMMYDCGGEMLCRNSLNLSVLAELLILILLCCALAGSCVERRAPGVCSWSTLANTDHCTLYYNVTVLRVGFPHARLLFYILNLFPPIPTLSVPSAAQSCVNVDDIGTVSEKGNVVEGINFVEVRCRLNRPFWWHMQPLTCSSQVMPNESFPCFTTDAVVGEFQIYFGGQPPFSSKVRSAPSTCTSALRLTTPHALSLNQLLATTSVTFGLTLALLFLPAMILINAVVDPDFLSKLRVSFVPHAHRHSFTFFFSFPFN